MPNLFLGFPVPRARIAEMIEGSAPPLEHAANHIPGGSDEIVLTADISAGQIVQWNGTKFIGIATPSGGIASRYDDPHIFLETNFESLDGFYNTGSSGAAVTISDAQLELATGTTINALAYLRKEHTIQFPLGSWDVVKKFRVMVYLQGSINEVGINFIGTGKSYTLRHVGFVVLDGDLCGCVHNGSSLTTVSLDDWGSGTYSKTKYLEAIFTPASKAEFYINGVKIDEITSGLPSGYSDAEHWICSYVKNTDGTNNLRQRLSHFEYYQAL